MKNFKKLLVMALVAIAYAPELLGAPEHWTYEIKNSTGKAERVWVDEIKAGEVENHFYVDVPANGATEFWTGRGGRITHIQRIDNYVPISTRENTSVTKFAKWGGLSGTGDDQVPRGDTVLGTFEFTDKGFDENTGWSSIDLKSSLPEGSYKNSCERCIYNRGVLSCVCEKIVPDSRHRGAFWRRPNNTTKSGCKKYKNVNGDLECE